MCYFKTGRIILFNVKFISKSICNFFNLINFYSKLIPLWQSFNLTKSSDCRLKLVNCMIEVLLPYSKRKSLFSVRPFLIIFIVTRESFQHWSFNFISLHFQIPQTLVLLSCILTHLQSILHFSYFPPS